jgi:hypothetical protein
VGKGTDVVLDSTAKPERGDIVALLVRPGRPGSQVVLKLLLSAIPHGVTFPHADRPASEALPLIFVECLYPRVQQFSFLCSELLGIHKAIGTVPVDAKPGPRGWFLDPQNAAPFVMEGRQ